MLQFGASLTDDARSVNYDRNTFIIQATGHGATTLSITTFIIMTLGIMTFSKTIHSAQCSGLL
jgi:hypothetical protein